jgi:ribosomal protein S18 acetylase RimI-like enzyme
MEIANGETAVIRQAVQADSRALVELLQTATYSHSHVDWKMPVEWLGTAGFVLSERPHKSNWFWGNASRLEACLAVGADPLPAAWVRVVALRHVDQPGPLLAAMMEQVLPYLRALPAAELGWLAADHWPDRFLPSLGFERAYEIMGYVKEGLSVPAGTDAPIHIRPVRQEDMATLEQIEADAFAPLWRHSAESLTLGWRQAISFDVAEWEGQVVGFQYSVRSYTGASAHLVRMTVRPDRQGRGVGRALLIAALEGYQRLKLQAVSLNTQATNIASRRLYEKFGFRPAGEELPVWVLPL